VLKDLNELIEKVIDFCQERTDVLMIGGVALIIIIIIVSIIRSIVKRDDEEDFDFDESEYVGNLTKSETKCDEEKPVEKCKQNVVFPEELIEELSKVSAGNLQEVEIKIQSAELKFKYGGARTEGEQAFEEIKFFEEKPVSEGVAATEAESENPEEKTEENPKEVKNEAPVKFGAGNFNISKSGKVFTEEELEKQIRD